MRASILLRALEASRALDRLVKKVGQINGAVFAAEHAIGDAFAADVTALVGCGVLSVRVLGARITVGKVTVEGLDLVDPDCAMGQHDKDLSERWRHDTYSGNRKSLSLHCM